MKHKFKLKLGGSLLKIWRIEDQVMDLVVKLFWPTFKLEIHYRQPGIVTNHTHNAYGSELFVGTIVVHYFHHSLL
jgi:hypothetical protein